MNETIAYNQDDAVLNNIAHHLTRLGGMSPSLLKDLLDVCIQDHAHAAICDRISTMLRHLNQLFDLYQIWFRVNRYGIDFSTINFESNARLWFYLPWHECGELQHFFS
jgi:hypothetical protein